MKTITLTNPGKFALSDTAAPETPAPGEALVRVRRVGVCGTDLHAYRGRQPFFTYPRILGHELGVEVLALNSAGNAGEIKIGDQCCVEPYLNCGKCIACRRGRTNCCVSLKTLGVHTDGGMREIIRIPINKLHKSEKLSLDQLALVETLGIGAHAVDRAKLDAGESVLVIGAGPIGLSAVQFARLANVKLIVMDVSPARLDFCQKQFKIDKAISASNIEKAFEELKAATNGDLPTAVFDATGNANSMMNAFRCTAHSGRLVFVGLVLNDITFNDPDFHRRELTLLATRNSTASDFKRIMGLIESGVVDTTPWITHRAHATEMIGQFDGWLKPENGCIKAVVEF
ncbi:MAG TPA: zinc-binding alcohol dehydrogenase family protein [Planctomycetota bacterium]|nr:zinc-binding alcohol dehydrogenase family protein [Planctomycetota bacterium]